MTADYTCKRISVVGLGYIGLPTAAMFASCKVEVVGVDVNQGTVDTINQGCVHIVEPELDSVVRAAVENGYLRATTIPEPADVFLIAVPTPFSGDKREPDLKYIKEATLAIAKVLKRGNLVVLESTSPVGTTEMMADWLSQARPDLSFPQTHGLASDIRVAHCPERVLPGKIMQELITNDRVIGGMTSKCSAMASALYKLFVAGECVVASGPRVAEMAKLTENSFRDVNIAFANELSVISDELGIDVWELITLANRHPRVDILRPGPGVGGHCIAVDPWFIVSTAPELSRIIATAREINDSKPKWVADKALKTINQLRRERAFGSKESVSVACYGLSFKPDIDDLRQSPAIDVARYLLGAEISALMVIEPNIKRLPKALNGAELVSLDFAMANADVHILLVGHSQFSGMQFPNSARVIDAVGLLSKE